MEVTSLTGMAKPMPMLPLCEPVPEEPTEAIEELMPTSWPLALTSAPPLLPGLIAALVWIALVTTGSPCCWLWPNGSCCWLSSWLVVPGRVAHGHHRVADLERVGVAGPDRAEVGGGVVELDDGQVGGGVGADHAGAVRAAVVERHRELGLAT